MENLFIETDENGNFVNHPAFESNLIDAFGEVPPNWVPFIRIEKPIPGLYQIVENNEPVYQKINNVWTDVWIVRDMTLEEKLAKQQITKDRFFNRPYSQNWSAWVFDEEICKMKPPIPRPRDGQNLRWCGAENNWKVVPDYPTDGKRYTFNFDTWVWQETGDGLP